ncbi:Na-translocating system protein MpsC family protein [Paenibacillus sp. XY044]|uniref:Na-translocating system protein MpsC family protein n=1 Tax=Paenibacillus sp. XY044 TaxID=2026089 RepID=UPI000B991D28|nr:Na-translocating system protein MpsC family protein [Paenibacillus sp. XY044]OZB96645.1 DUF2294 domain-containing protein [Paenibacillus sp. XY044]
MVHLDTNEFKQKLSQVYNEVSKELFGFGTSLLKTSIQSDAITLYARHRRSPRSTVLEGEVPALKYEVDFYMSMIYKKKLKSRLEEELGLNIEVLLRDYDPATQWAVTNIILSQPE